MINNLFIWEICKSSGTLLVKNNYHIITITTFIKLFRILFWKPGKGWFLHFFWSPNEIKKKIGCWLYSRLIQLNIQLVGKNSLNMYKPGIGILESKYLFPWSTYASLTFFSGNHTHIQIQNTSSKYNWIQKMIILSLGRGPDLKYITVPIFFFKIGSIERLANF